MALTSNELADFRRRLTRASRPLVFYDDDPDGLCSFLLCQKANPDVRGVRAARGPELGEVFLRKVDEHQPDIIFILDKPKVSEDFLDGVKQPVVWLDHHPLENRRKSGNLTYYNPRLHNERDARSVAYWVWRSLGGPLWIATAGTVGDWYTILVERFSKQYPDLAPKKNDMAHALFDSPLGELVQTLNFLLKGRSSDVRKSVNALTRIDDPREILDQSTPRGKFLHKQAAPIRAAYQAQRDQALATKVRDDVFIHVFDSLEYSMIGDVANEMLVRKKADAILLARRTNDDFKFSMRSKRKDLLRVLHKALNGLDGYGGGHRNAVGGAVQSRHWEEFVERVRKS